MHFNLSKELAKDMELLATLSSPMHSHIGIMVAGENYSVESLQPVIRVYLIGLVIDEWFIEDELQAVAFPNYKSAKCFAEKLGGISAIDLLLLMNGQQIEKSEGITIQ